MFLFLIILTDKSDLKPKSRTDGGQIHTRLENLVIRAVGHVEAAQLHSDLVAARLAHGEGHFYHVGLWLLQNLLRDGDVQRQLDVGDVDPQSNGPVGGERLSVLVEQLQQVEMRSSASQDLPVRFSRHQKCDRSSGPSPEL